MILIGISGKAGHGKDTVGDILVEDYGFIKFSMSDPLYKEVADNFGVSQDFLRDRATKEARFETLSPAASRNQDFRSLLHTEGYGDHQWLSPRVVLQLWGTEYRRKMFGADYWINRAQDALNIAMERVIDDVLAGRRDRIAGFVNTSIRFENEATWIRRNHGVLWRVVRPGVRITRSDHSSEKLPYLLPHEIVIVNGGSLADLRTATHLVMQGAQVVDTRQATEDTDAEERS